MDMATMRRRVAQARVGRLATVTAAGRPHVVPCCFVLDDDTVFSAVDAKPKSTLALRRLDNLQAHPAASLLVDHYSDDWSALWWVRLDGDGRVVSGGAERDRAIALLTGKYEQYVATPPPGPVIALDVTAWRSWRWLSRPEDSAI
jgi:PPOX class probable F420-dependent enzyme